MTGNNTPLDEENKQAFDYGAQYACMRLLQRLDIAINLEGKDADLFVCQTAAAIRGKYVAIGNVMELLNKSSCKPGKPCEQSAE